MSQRGARFPSVHVVVVTFNGAPWIDDLLSSLHSSDMAVQVVVVDNASSDSTPTIAKADPGVTVIETGSNLGFGRANNLGIAHSLARGADFVFIINQDTVVSPSAISTLVTSALANQQLGIVCPLQLNESGDAIDATFARYYLAPHAPKLIDDAVLRTVGACYQVESAPAAAWMLSRDFLLNVGGFDPLFFMYCEDDDLCSRARHHGFAIGIVPGATFIHRRGFYRGAQEQSRFQKIARKTSRFRSVLVKDAKKPEGNFFKNFWHGLTRHVFHGLESLVGHLDWITFVSCFVAVFRVCVELPSIYRHRRICLTRGAHWLSLEKSP